MDININQIRIPKLFRTSTPNQKKINKVKEFYIKNGCLNKPIVILSNKTIQIRKLKMWTF
ncbi:hypothetical protein [Pseudobacteroides cellulosolvens]|uniref:Uncharacterized protein n=1 Tax=Pseudobacteroides cellulosolvens ATCC 35603 = DSM 2933 TaxID=398512 RepID=A0A0L6JGH9_9FIRM|nr:hypothetical protein [Pseudobacteroides cellulosolvens]KNY24976.1 hypothetical protein Bccel_0233 [Pseudobacteroides cellulosolvens ATCC 35603 = DSM 2933]